jgi:hypothetical protein
MLRALLAWLTPGSENTDDRESAEREAGSSAESDDSTFLRSRLDASVLQSHGVGTADEPVQELESETRELEDQLPDQDQQFEDPKR